MHYGIIIPSCSMCMMHCLLTALIALVTLIFWPLNKFTCNARLASILPIIGFLVLSVVELVEACDRQTDGRTNTAHHFIMPLPMEVKGMTTLTYCKPSDIMYTVTNWTNPTTALYLLFHTHIYLTWQFNGHISRWTWLSQFPHSWWHTNPTRQ